MQGKASKGFQVKEHLVPEQGLNICMVWIDAALLDSDTDSPYTTNDVFKNVDLHIYD